MSRQQQNEFWSNVTIHQYYTDIINCMPNIVYWVDMDFNLQGCNKGFVKLLGLKRIKDFSGTPYETMSKRLPWTKERIAEIKLDDLNVIFSGKPRYEIEEAPMCNTEGALIYYLSTRVPLFDADKNVIGLVVVFVDITAQKAMQKQLNLTVEPLEYESEVNIDRIKTPIRVLLVEDSEMAQVQEKSLFIELNCDVDIAKTDDEAMALFSPGKYAIVIMDINLKDTSGYIVSKEIRKVENGCGLIRISFDLGKITDNELRTRLNNTHAYVLFNEKVYYIDWDLKKKELETECHEQLKLIFPVVANELKDALEEHLTKITSLTGHTLEKNTKHHVPIIALTRHKVDDVEYDCHYYGMEGVITKPLTKEQALQIIKRYVFNEDILVNGLRFT